MITIEQHTLTDPQILLLREGVSALLDRLELAKVPPTNTLLDLDEVLNSKIHGGEQTILIQYRR